MEQSKTSSVHKARALEAYLVAAARTGDTRALDQLVRLVQPNLLRHAIRLLNDTTGAHDITQAAWLDIIQSLPRLRDISAFRAFALQIVTRKVAGTIKSRQRDRELAKDWTQLSDVNSAPMGEINADAQAVRQAIAKLTPALQATLALFYLDELTVTEVATALDIPIGTVKTRLMHARDKLRQILIGDDNDQTR